MKERLEQLLTAKGYTSQRFAEIMGVQPSGISHILAGRNKPRFDFLERLLRRFPEISPDWLLLGDGPMFRDTELVGSEAVRDTREYLSAREGTVPDNAGILFPDLEQKQAVSETNGTLGDNELIDPTDGPEEPYETDYFAGGIWEGKDVKPLSGGVPEDPVVFENEEEVANEVHVGMQDADKSNITCVTESEGSLPYSSSKAYIDKRSEDRYTDDHSYDHPGTVNEIDKDKPSVVTNVISAAEDKKKVIKVILLYDNGTFKSYENE